MAKYTIELRRVCDIYTREEVENWFKDYDIEDYLLPTQIDVVNTAKIWNKDKLASNIVDYYYMREIGQETPTLFKHYVKITMKEIMEKYFPLIYTNSLEYDPLINENYNETFQRKATGTADSSSQGNSNSNSNSNSNGININNDTPQGQVDRQSLLNGQYASTAIANDNISNITDTTNTTSSGNSNTNTNEEYTRHVEGNRGIDSTYQKLIEQFRKNIIAVNNMIIKELEPLFMGLY